MLCNNPILFREHQSWKARARRLPWWRRGHHATLPLIWLITAGACCLLDALNTPRIDAHELRECLWASTIVSCYLQLGYLTFRGLISGASVLVRERELQTMDTLLSSPLPVRELVVGKWLAATVPLVKELVITLPVALAIAWGQQPLSWDGMATWKVGDCFVLSAGLVVVLTSVGVLLSTRATNSGRAATQAVLMGLALTMGTYVVDLLAEVFSGSRYLHPFLCWLNPWAALWSIQYSDRSHLGPGAISPYLWLGSVASYLLLGAACGLLAVRRLSRPARS